MGGRGSKSGFTTPKARRGQFESYVNNGRAFELIQEETGFGEAQTQRTLDSMIDYCGGDYMSFTKGREKEKTNMIDNALANMGAYDGVIYRGISIDPYDYDFGLENVTAAEVQQTIRRKIKEDYKVGEIVSVTRTSGVLSSWSSKESVAQRFSKKTWDDDTSIVFKCANNKSAVGIQHISHFGSTEAEVLAPSTAKWKIKKVKITNKVSGQYSKNYGQTVEVEVEEV